MSKTENMDIQTGTLTISDVVYPGKGLARHDGCVVFVPYVLPRETVRVRVTASKKNYVEAKVVEIVEPSERRIKPVCSMVGVCQGCCYQHAEYGEEIRLKQAQFANMLERQAGINADAIDNAALASPISLEYRNKITLHVGSSGKRMALGYVAEDNTTVIDIDHCPLAVPHLNKLLKSVRRDQRFMSSLRMGMTVTLRYTRHDGALVWRGNLTNGGSWLIETTGIGNFHVPRGSFYQVNPRVAERLVEEVSGLIERIRPDSVVDLYCGVGVFAIAAGKLGVKRIYGVDSDAEAIRAAERNAGDHKINIAHFIAQPAHQGLSQALKEINPRKSILIVDPTRMGLERAVMDLVKTSKFANIIYVSCAPDILARDLAILKTAGYYTAGTRILDMFPRTPYFESVTHLSRK